MHPVGTLLRFIWHSSRRAAVFMVGVVLLIVGFIMFVTPGPGIVLVVAGLAVLATEFAWAEHLLDKAKEQAARAGRSAQRVPWVAAVTSAAGRRLVPRRWRTVSAGSVTVTSADGVVTTERTIVSATEITMVVPGDPGDQALPATDAARTAHAAGAMADPSRPRDATPDTDRR